MDRRRKKSHWRPNWDRIGAAVLIILIIGLAVYEVAKGNAENVAYEEATEATVKAVEPAAEEVTTEAVKIESETAEDVTEAESEEETTTSFWADEYELLAYVVWGEIAICDNAEDYRGAYLQACVVLNRVKSDWYPDTITEVIYQEGQWVPEWYEYLKESGSEPNAACYAAVDAAIGYNGSPATLLYSDSKESGPEGTYLYYASPTGQQFYAVGGAQ